MEPTWTDIAQAIAAMIAIPGAIAAFVVLFKRDRAREAEVSSLSTIAGQLTQMQLESEKRHKASKKPIIGIAITHLQNEKKIRIDFTNTNHTTTLKSFSQNTHLEDFTILATTINQQNTTQSFWLGISYKNEPPEYVVLHMDYETEEGYTFIQDLMVWFENGQYVFSPSAIIDKVNSHE
ncbi:MAG: hypothetical protein FD170_3136 [Bacteroidetes bacterium]|nr:MAG: hypothetical protein FD170_3136 [Bacteroidota bacterium]